MWVGPFAFRYQGNGATPCQYIDTTVVELLFLSLTVEALQGKMCQNSLPSGGGVGHLEPTFQQKGLPPCQYIDTTRKAIDCATTLPLTVFM